MVNPAIQDNRAMEIAVDKCGDDWDELIDAARAEFAAANAIDSAIQKEGGEST